MSDRLRRLRHPDPERLQLGRVHLRRPDGSLDTIHAFEDWYESTYGQKVKVNYSTYASNEDLYAKLKSGAVSYDVIIPSDYMIARLKDEDAPAPEL
ncbi:MAG: hypothetical protein ACLSCQ_10890 [Evtepia gabavorous]